MRYYVARETQYIIEGRRASLFIFEPKGVTMGRKRSQAQLESDFQSHLIKQLGILFPGCFILKNDSAYLQGVPDLLVLYRNKWAMLEVKAAADSEEQPNQRYYVEQLDDMSFAAFIFPENEEEVLNDLQHAFRPRRASRSA